MPTKSCGEFDENRKEILLRIQKIKLYRIDLPVADQQNGYTFGGGTFYKQDAVIVEIICDNQMVGWGEHTAIGGTYVSSCWRTTLAALEHMAPALIGQDPRAVDVIRTLMDETLKGHYYAKSAVDFACWDLLGKSCDMPVYQLLGGRQLLSAPMYSVVQAFADPEKTRRFFDDVRRNGYKLFQIKVGDKVQKAVERVEAICPYIDSSTEQVFVDGNTQWNRKQAFEFLQQVKDHSFVFEQPCLRYEDCLEIRRRTARPMKLDESLSAPGILQRALADNAMDVACLKISYFGGLSGGRRARDMCIAHGVLCHIEDTWGTEITTSAYAHLAVATPKKWLYCTTDLHNYNNIRIAEKGSGPVVENGRLRPSDLPGLGVEPDRAKLKEPVAIYG